jgi:hypothetical protein
VNPKIANFITVGAKHYRQAEHFPLLAAGSFNINTIYSVHADIAIQILFIRLLAVINRKF